MMTFFSSQLRKNMLSGMGMTLLQVCAMMLGYPLYLHFLGYEGYGLWLVLGAVLSFAQLGNLGIGQAVMKLVAEETGKYNTEGVRNYIASAIMLLGLSGTVAWLFITLFRSHLISVFGIQDTYVETATRLLPYMGLSNILVLLTQALHGAISGLGRMDLAHVTQTVTRFLSLGISVLLLHRGYGIASLLLGHVLSHSFVLVANLFILRHLLQGALLCSSFDWKRCNRLLRFGGTLFAGSLMQMLLHPFNKLILARFVGLNTIPIYEIAFSGSMQVRSLLEVALRSLMPEISRLAACLNQQARQRIRDINRKALYAILSGGLLVYGILLIGARPLLMWWLGPRSVAVLPGVFRIFLVGSFLGVLGVPAYYTLVGLGCVRQAFVGCAIQSSISCALLMAAIASGTFTGLQTVGLSVTLATACATVYLLWVRQRLQSIQTIGVS